MVAFQPFCILQAWRSAARLGQWMANSSNHRGRRLAANGLASKREFAFPVEVEEWQKNSQDGMEENLHSWVLGFVDAITMFNISTRVNHLVSTTLTHDSRLHPRGSARETVLSHSNVIGTSSQPAIHGLESTVEAM